MAQDVQLVIFKLANEDYGLPIQKVQEINRMVPVTKLPQTPEFMEGIINLRGRVIPVVDLRKRFGLAAKPHEDDTRIMIIDIDGQTVGIIVDAVNEVLEIDAREIAPPPSFGANIQTHFIEGMGRLEHGFIIILQIDRILSAADVALMERIVETPPL